FTDPGPLDTHTATINWGDGTSNTGTVTESNGSGTVTGSHTWAEEGFYPVTVTVTDNGGLSGSTTFTTAVTDVPPTLAISGAGTVNEGATYTLTLSGVPDAVDHDPINSWTVTWGDGGTQTVNGNPTGLTHVYADGPNAYTISATASDADGTYAAGSVAVTV